MASLYIGIHSFIKDTEDYYTVKLLLKYLTTSLVLINLLFIKTATAFEFETDKPQYHVCYVVFPLNNSANYSQVFKTPKNSDFESLTHYYLAEAVNSYNYSQKDISDKLLETYKAVCTDKPSFHDDVDDVLFDLLDLFEDKGLIRIETKFMHIYSKK